jgi:hypothetical protein
MKKSAAILALILLLPFLIVNAAPATKAQDTPTVGDGVKIWSPCNRTYSPNDIIAIKAQIDIRYGEDLVFSGNYSLDNRPSEEFDSEAFQTSFWSVTYGCVGANATLPKLPEGQHKLTIYLSTEYSNAPLPNVVSGKATVYFTITGMEQQNTPTYEDGVTIYSPSNKTYDPTDTIVVNASTACMLGANVYYKGTVTLDGVEYPLQTKSGQKASWDPFFGWLSGTVTLPKLSEGQHNIPSTY